MRNARGRVPLVILLLTPSQTKFLDDEDPFVPNLLARILPISEAPRVDMVAAVVDRIPYPPSCYPLPTLGDWWKVPSGFEGFSVAVAYSDIAAPDLWSPSNVQKALGLESALQRPVLSFRFSCNEPRVYSELASQHVQSRISRVVQLPVANTLFHNSRPSTMFAISWVSSTDPGSPNAYVRDKKINLAQQALNLFGLCPGEVLRAHSKLVLDLKPMTLPRIIATGLGNIIRELYSGRELNETMPASQELENAISREVENGPIPDQRPGVWALITPRTKWVDEPQIGTWDAAHWIERGSQLHRILSGGGGWGAKKGLLALDPETKFHIPQLETDRASENGQVTDGNLGQALPGLFEPGDIITFFHRSSRPNTLPANAIPTPCDWHVKSPPSVCFGSAPSTADIIPNQGTASDDMKPFFKRMLVKGHFGMLSEQGMHLHADREVPATSMEQSGTVVDTKIDPPNAYFSMVGRRRSKIQPTSGKGLKITGTRRDEAEASIIRRITPRFN